MTNLDVLVVALVFTALCTGVVIWVVLQARTEMGSYVRQLAAIDSAQQEALDGLRLVTDSHAERHQQAAKALEATAESLHAGQLRVLSQVGAVQASALDLHRTARLEAQRRLADATETWADQARALAQWIAHEQGRHLTHAAEVRSMLETQGREHVETLSAQAMAHRAVTDALAADLAEHRAQANLKPVNHLESQIHEYVINRPRPQGAKGL